MLQTETENESSITKDTSTERFQPQIPVLQRNMSISKAGPSSLKDDRAEYKDKSPDVSDSHRNIRTMSNLNLKLSKFNNLCIESTEKLLKDQ